MPIVRLILDAWDFRQLQDRKTVFLEITPPISSAKTPHATTQLFAAMHGLGNTRSRKDWFLRRKNIQSFEVVSSRSQGIRYVVQLSPNDVPLFKQLVVSYLPDVQFKEVEDYLTNVSAGSPLQITDYKQDGHFAYPLASHESLSQHDPIAYIAGAMTKPLADELIAFQVVLSPASRRVATKIHNKLLSGQDAGLRRKLWHYPFMLVWKLVLLTLGILRAVLELLGEEVTGQRGQSLEHDFTRATPQGNRVVDGIHNKLSEPLFNVDIRTLVAGSDKQRGQGLANSLYMFHVPGYQGLVSRSSFPNAIKAKYRTLSFCKRLPAVFTRSSCVLAASEIASLYHFPYGDSARPENLIASHARTLAAPISLKRQADSNGLDVILGENNHHGSSTPIGLTAAERERHVYVIGGTGNGKTTMLQYALVQDIRNGKGVAVIDPHGDLAETLLRYIPEDRMKDVIYFNPRDISHPIGLNLLEQPEGLSEDDLLLEQDFITESVVSIFRKIFSDDDSGGHRIEHFLRNSIHTAFTVPDATLFTVYKLLTNTAFRRAVTSKLTDEDLIDFWKGEFNKAGDFQKVKMSGGVNAKLGRFQRSAVTRRILEQPKSTIDFDDIIQNNKILICNFAKGHIGEDTSALLGISVLTKLQLAALRRARLGQTERTPFYLYVDEFQNFATTSFVQLLSEARKYKLFLTMAEQSTAQQEERRLIDIILANVGTIVCFRSGSPIDEELVLPLFRPYLDKGEIANLSAYNFYAKLSALNSQEPVSGETLLLKDEGSEYTARTVTAISQDTYASEIKRDIPDEKTTVLRKKKASQPRATLKIPGNLKN
jgi:DNA helicase HerA-like ATPase